jgi:hypothetical protein
MLSCNDEQVAIDSLLDSVLDPVVHIGFVTFLKVIDDDLVRHLYLQGDTLTSLLPVYAMYLYK